MVHFGKRLLALQYEPWREHYIDYNQLKRILEESDETSSSRTALDLRKEFQEELDSQIENTVLFSLQEQGKIAERLTQLKQEKLEVHIAVQVQRSFASTTASGPNEARDTLRTRIHGLLNDYRYTGEQVLQLVRFTELNLTGIRKILKKHDRIYSFHKLTHQYFDEHTLHWDGNISPDRHLNQLLHHDGVGALVATLQYAFCDLRQCELTLDNQRLAPPRRNLTEPDLATVLDRQNSLPYYNNGNHKHLGKPTSRALTTTNLQALAHDTDNQQSPFRFPEEPVLFRIQVARNRLYESSRFVQLLAAPAMFADHEASEQGDAVEMQTMMGAQATSKVSNILNLMSTFLYLTNYYIAAPTSGSYAAKLDGSEALAGVVIGMTSFAALAGTLLYSWWTSHSYKAALAFAATSAILGNVLYALALPCKSLMFVLLGRLLIGFGSCRSINRRYIADSYSREDRTAASAAFVTAGSLGMAVGPAVAALLDFIPDGSHWISVENAPGWIMCVAWVVYVVFLLAYFRDPPRPKPNAVLLQTAEKDTIDETKPLLSRNVSTVSSDVSAELPLWCNVPVMVTLFICFLLKMTLECCLSSTATITAYFFGWSVSKTGVYLALLGLLMFPANLLVAYFSKRNDDRDLIFGTLALMFLGTWGIVNYGATDSYTTVQYIAFGVVIFVSTNALEGPNMSLLSKTIPLSWSRGFFNMGLLATESGTFGRTVGDAVITLFGLGSTEAMLNHTFIFLGVLVGMTVLLTHRMYPLLEPRDKD